ncbi:MULTISPECIES: NAD-dependent epimerase/dehydratase family protein [unclassified Ruegeria]|uniref:NAD-dependent epimerase/dehydratase family protein n=2 Tax=Ruegeria TaxID=97050 RepID=UPI001491DA0D|nr:NAD-dependent epimerase/dehydratase family protein [Ruegeria sp. HKCCD4332]NOD90958.1 NAD-dependent epimerase/dehydratase family protein [Ruegeria sp. HKCCD4318]NOG11788.1 NAD-dependent epimerase/dehydratase family protein [Ruegeria sp. HKCCD4315]
MTPVGSEQLGGTSVLVTGATGFIGKRLVPALLQIGARVTVVLRSRHGAATLKRMGARVVTGSMADRATMETVLRDQDVLFHLAYDMRATAADNLAQFDVLRTAAETAGVGRIVHISSIVTYDGWPQQDLTEDSSSARAGGGQYRQAKRAMEQALTDGACPVAILQPTLVYGPGSMFWTDQLAAWLAAGTVVLPNPEGVCNAVFVDDLVLAMLRAATVPGLQQERFIISGAAPIAWSDLLNGYADIIGQGNVHHVPLADLKARLSPETPDDSADTQSLAARISAAARVWIGRDRFEKLVHRVKQHLPQSDVVYPDRYMLDLLSAKGQCRIDHARTRLGYAPTHDLEAGLAATRDHLQARFPK